MANHASSSAPCVAPDLASLSSAEIVLSDALPPAPTFRYFSIVQYERNLMGVKPARSNSRLMKGRSKAALCATMNRPGLIGGSNS